MVAAREALVSDREFLARALPAPLLRWAVGLVLFVLLTPGVWLVRGFVVEPFRLPVVSVAPNLLVGDHVLVDKLHYGLWVPTTVVDLPGQPPSRRTEWLDRGDPGRGDLVVFRYPREERITYLKRVVGVPGDTLRVENNRVVLDGEPWTYQARGKWSYLDAGCQPRDGQRLVENSPSGAWEILVREGMPGPLADHPRDGTTLTVPPGHVFVLGDNRDNSEDSRAWGFVRYDQILGRVATIWFSWDACAEAVREDRLGRPATAPVEVTP